MQDMGIFDGKNKKLEHGRPGTKLYRTGMIFLKNWIEYGNRIFGIENRKSARWKECTNVKISNPSRNFLNPCCIFDKMKH